MNFHEDSLNQMHLQISFPPEFCFDLQLFAAEDEGRTEAPSERRVREEREKGNVPKSHELTSVLVMLSGIVLIFILGKYFFTRFLILIKKYFNGVGSNITFSEEHLVALFRSAGEDLFYLLLPILAITLVVGFMSGVAQVGFMFTPRALEMNFSRIVPNFKKVLPVRQTLVNLGKSLVKIFLIGWISYAIIANDFIPILMSGNLGLLEAMKLILNSSFKIFLFSGIFLLAVGIADFYYQKYEFTETLKLTPSEAKREVRDDQGDPEMIARRRQKFREGLRRVKKVAEADVVITNPTHYAVGLKYTIGVDIAPVVVVKGEDMIALAIRREAKRLNIPIREDRALAQVLYRTTEVGQPIPETLYQAMQKIILSLDKFRRYTA